MGLILAAMMCARTCAMSFNRIVDRRFDAANPRTANRHLPAGQIGLASAWSLWFLSAAGLDTALRKGEMAKANERISSGQRTQMTNPSRLIS